MRLLRFEVHGAQERKLAVRIGPSNTRKEGGSARAVKNDQGTLKEVDKAHGRPQVPAPMREPRRTEAWRHSSA